MWWSARTSAPQRRSSCDGGDEGVDSRVWWTSSDAECKDENGDLRAGGGPSSMGRHKVDV